MDRLLTVFVVVMLFGAPVAGQVAPIVIAHRGASGHRPEHTIASYRLAIEMGADFIEPDLVSTRDGVLIARHENEISGTTDVADRFPDRRRTKTIDGQAVSGWFTEDFSVAEMKTLRAKERLPFRSHAHDGQFQVPTFDEVLDLAATLGRERGRPVGVYPETKHPTYFRGIGLPLEEKLVAALEAHGLNRKDAPVFIQSFETENLRALRARTPVRLIQLIGNPAMLAGESLTAIARYADGVGPEKSMVQPVAPDGSLLPPTDVVARAHDAGLLVHIWTIRVDTEFLPASYRGDGAAEFRRFRELGVDGMFTDFPDVGVRALRGGTP